MLAAGEYHFDMQARISPWLAAVLFLVSGAFAQGPPASVTSLGFGGGRGGGPPASVTSPGFGKVDSGRVFFRPPHHNPFQNPRPQHNHNFFPNRGFVTPVYAVPYYVPVEVESPVDDTMERAAPEQYLGGPTLFDRRGAGAPAAVAPPEPVRHERESESEEEAPVRETAPVADRPDTMLVFKDGHHLEVQNYAIVGDMLYDMTPGHSHKVLLADLDLDATTKQNDDRGIDFRLPPRLKAK
jgi:hypothetical protein